MGVIYHARSVAQRLCRWTSSPLVVGLNPGHDCGFFVLTHCSGWFSPGTPVSSTNERRHRSKISAIRVRKRSEQGLVLTDVTAIYLYRHQKAIPSPQNLSRPSLVDK